GDEALAGVFRVGFAAEDSDLDAKGVEKLKRKGLHAIVANDISRRDIGFGSEYNAGVLLFADGARHELEKATKREMADRILDLLLPKLQRQVAPAPLVAEHYWVPVVECIRAMLPRRGRGTGSTGAHASSRQRRHTRLLELATGPPPVRQPITLTAEQDAALEVIEANPITLLHGVIASGKTEVDLAAAAP